jgi:hypothetical protein
MIALSSYYASHAYGALDSQDGFNVQSVRHSQASLLLGLMRCANSTCFVRGAVWTGDVIVDHSKGVSFLAMVAS